MTAEYVGSFTVGQCVPVALQAQAALDANVGLVLPSLQAKLAGALEAQAQITLQPPSIAGILEILAAFDLTPPTIDLNLAAMATVIAEIQAELGSVSASASLSASILAILAGAGIHLLTVEAPASQVGAELQSLMSQVGDGTVRAVVLATTTSSAWEGLKLAVKTS